ncbi:MAG: response regulator transcription factor [Lachnospiraceae bacterium]|nr:response regulator transcription factor [Lachnospiraceae bacterium]
MVDGKNKILIIEDDPDIRASIRILLEEDGFLIEEAKDGNDGLNKFNDNVDLIILDIMMPDKSGYEVCAEIRKRSYVPILFLTAKSSDSDKTWAFAAGGDDYLVKPFSFSELSDRVKAQIRRNNIYNTEKSQKKTSTWITYGKLRINNSINGVLKDNKEIVLTEKEYEILRLFVNNPDTIFSIEDIYETVWEEKYISSYANTVMVHIRNLRTKIEESPSEPLYICTVWGRGYRIGHGE